MKFDDKYKLIVVGISGVLAGVVVIMFICCYKNKKKKFQLPEPPQTPEWQRQIVSAPTLQTRNIDVGNGTREDVSFLIFFNLFIIVSQI